MHLWIIPTIYVTGSLACGLILPRIEQAYLGSFSVGLSVSSAQSCLAATASGMMALTGVVFAMAFVMVQFSAIAYSPRLVLWFAKDRVLFHSLGVFSATFVYALFTLAWVDRHGSGAVPTVSMLLVGTLLVASMLLFSKLVQRLTALQITSVLQLIGSRGRSVIQDMLETFRQQTALESKGDGSHVRLGPISQTIVYSGDPRTITRLEIDTLVQHARRAGATVAMACAVGDTLLEGSVVLHVHGASERLAENDLMRAIHLGTERTFAQDPKYPIRLLVDIAIKALSPAINDPTTAIQAIDQIEDLLRRLSRHELDTGFVRDPAGALRLVVLMPTWEDYLMLAFDEIRQFGAGSIQVMRRLRAALTGVLESTTVAARVETTRRYLRHLDLTIEHSQFDSEDKARALQEDRQGLGLTRRTSSGNVD